MAAVRVEQSAIAGGRVRALGRCLGIDWKQALGALVLVWNECQEQGRHTLPAVVVDGAAEHDGFAAAMVSCELAALAKDGSVRVRGTRGRIEWLRERRENARLGGLAKAKQTASTRQALGSDLGCPPAPAPAPALTPDPAPVPDPDPGGTDRSTDQARECEESRTAVRDVPSRSRRGPEPAPEAIAVAEGLLRAIRSHTPDYEAGRDGAVTSRWARDIDLAIRRDGRTAEQLARCADWIHRRPEGAFWRANVLSGATLRRQYDRLAIEARRKQSGGVRHECDDLAELAQKLRESGQ